MCFEVMVMFCAVVFAPSCAAFARASLREVSCFLRRSSWYCCVCRYCSSSLRLEIELSLSDGERAGVLLLDDALEERDVRVVDALCLAALLREI